MGGVVGDNPDMKECSLFRTFWTCLKCDSTEGKVREIPREPSRCSECGYHGFNHEWHIVVAH